MGLGVHLDAQGGSTTRDEHTRYFLADDDPEAKTKAEIAAGLQAKLKLLGKKAGQISKHLTGDAFDVRPVTKDAAQIKKSRS